MDKTEFITTKLNNMCNWIQSNNILPPGDPLLLKLISYASDIGCFIVLIKYLSTHADINNDISNEQLKMFSDLYGVDFNKFKSEDLLKFKRYINIFISCIRK